MPENFDVVVIGNAGIDTNVYLPGREIDFTVEANFSENKDTIGQAGGYASLGYASLGYRTAYIGYFGDDFQGQHIRSEFSRRGIDIRATFLDPAGTARSVNFMYADGRRKNFYDGKGHMQLQPDLPSCHSILTGARLVHFNIPNWARELLPVAREARATIVCDIQDIVDIDDPYRRDFIQYADILFLSAANFSDPGYLLQQLNFNYPQKTIIASRGSQGCGVMSAQGLQYFNAVDLPDPVIDTNGAGDSLAVGFSASYVLEDYTLAESVLRGQIAARHTCTLKATSDGLIHVDQLDYWFTKFRHELP